MLIIGLVNRHLLLPFLRKRKLKSAIVNERLERHSQLTVFKLYPITVWMQSIPFFLARNSFSYTDFALSMNLLSICFATSSEKPPSFISRINHLSLFGSAGIGYSVSFVYPSTIQHNVTPYNSWIMSQRDTMAEIPSFVPSRFDLWADFESPLMPPHSLITSASLAPIES